MNIYITILTTIMLYGLLAQPVMAQNLATADASAQQRSDAQGKDARVAKLRAYLETHASPLADEAEHFVAEADRLGLDWKLVAAIAGVESTFGKFIPRNSYNGWGWGIFTGASDGIHFKDWRDGITTVSEGLRYRYIDKGATSIEQIGRIYAASPAWSTKVRFFLTQIEDYVPTRVEHLAVTI
jgi:hypothetical protein